MVQICKVQVLINGEANNDRVCKRGLRQGDSFFSLLFVLLDVGQNRSELKGLSGLPDFRTN